MQLGVSLHWAHNNNKGMDEYLFFFLSARSFLLLFISMSPREQNLLYGSFRVTCLFVRLWPTSDFSKQALSRTTYKLPIPSNLSLLQIKCRTIPVSRSCDIVPTSWSTRLLKNTFDRSRIIFTPWGVLRLRCVYIHRHSVGGVVNTMPAAWAF